MYHVQRRLSLGVALIWVMIATGSSRADLPNPVLNAVFPAGVSAGRTTRLTVQGNHLDGIKGLVCSAPGARLERLEADQFQITVPTDTRPGLYDLWVLCQHGLSSPRPFSISRRPECVELESNDAATDAQAVQLSTVVNGRIAKGGDLDCFRFAATQDQRVIVECLARRIDSRLRAVLEIQDPSGRTLAVNRGYVGVDPLIDFLAPADGDYVVKVYDLTHTGGAEHYYRLDIDARPRVAFAVPCVVQTGTAARVMLHGWNLKPRDQGKEQAAASKLDRVEVEIAGTRSRKEWPLPVRLLPAQTVLDGFAYFYPDAHAPVVVGVTDVPVVHDHSANHSPESALKLVHPCEVSGQLEQGDERDWYQIDARHGEVLFIEGLGQRIDSPVDLDVRILDARGMRELLRIRDEVRNIGGPSLPTNHLDPAGRWVVPADGRYLIMVRNLIGGLDVDPRRVYRLSVRREEPDLRLAVVARRSEPAALNIRRGGRAVLDVVAFRRRGLNGSVRIAALDLPDGIECPDVWLGPGVERTCLVVSANKDAPEFFDDLRLEGSAPLADRRTVRGGVIVRSGLPNGWSRLVSRIPLAVVDEAPIHITANGHETRDHHLYGQLAVRHSPGGILDVAVQVQRGDTGHRSAVKLTGVGLPELIDYQTATIPAGVDKGYISFYLPPSLPVGWYSLVIRAETTVADAAGSESVTVYSPPVTFQVQPAAFRVEVDPDAPRQIRRGEVVQVKYTARRLNGFISKIHTELAAPGVVTDVEGLRGRGVTFVGQTEIGTIQIIANDDAPLRQQPFLRLYAVGVLEDEAIYHGGCFLDLEVTE